ncbi:hypothetical protein AVEN_1505-1 [Araneus ventricosus]|uniref:Uncharacterized protein n=1 Tax=Araneus ventricosus TaxID=182803 RepID=A0A4Y2GEV7_ARAVE|nr:hypothetical protein AVEN_1505-1 [Araneus ventricosus]
MAHSSLFGVKLLPVGRDNLQYRRGIVELIEHVLKIRNVTTNDTALEWEIAAAIATIWLFDDGPRNLEPWSDDEENSCDDALSPNILTTQAGRDIHDFKFNVHQAHIQDKSVVESTFGPGILRP